MLQIGANARTRRDVHTNNEAQSVWRGHYSGHVHKPGYHDADVVVDLMLDARTLVRCTLTRADASELSSCFME